MLRHLILAVACIVGSATAANAQQPVFGGGYLRSNGTYVQPYYRTAPDRNFYNNWSTGPNANPYTGQFGTRYTPPTYCLQPTNQRYYYRRNW